MFAGSTRVNFFDRVTPFVAFLIFIHDDHIILALEQRFNIFSFGTYNQSARRTNTLQVYYLSSTPKELLIRATPSTKDSIRRNSIPNTPSGMSLTLLILALATHILSTQALPQSPTTPNLTNRGLPGAFYLCTSPNWEEPCNWFPPNGGCQIAGTGKQKPRSIGPDPGGYCILYSDIDCAGPEIERLVFPGKSNNLPDFLTMKCFADGTGPILAGRPIGM